MVLENISPKKNIIVAGVGNLMRGDDGVGIYTVKKLKKKGFKQVYNCQTTPENYLSKICRNSPDLVLFIDAVELGKTPGYIDIKKAKEVSAGFTTHNSGLDLVAEFIQNDCGADIYVIAVQPEKLEGNMSEEVKTAGDKIASILEEKLCMNR